MYGKSMASAAHGSLGKKAISVSCNAEVVWLQQTPPRRLLGGVARKHIVLYGMTRTICGVDFRLRLTKNGSSLDCTLLANGCTALYVIRVIAKEGYNDYAFVGLATCESESDAKADNVHQTFAISVRSAVFGRMKALTDYHLYFVISRTSLMIKTI